MKICQSTDLEPLCISAHVSPCIAQQNFGKNRFSIANWQRAICFDSQVLAKKTPQQNRRYYVKQQVLSLKS